jgi:predicted TIM-barrel fold metal-dependent hydrolase
MINWKKSWPDQWEGLPVDVMPCSNDEFLPPPPQPHHIAIMDLQDREVERVRRKFGMSRRRFVRTSAAMTIGFWAIDVVKGGRWGNYASAHNTATLDACDLEWAGRGGLETVMNLPGEFIFDIQSHHVDPEGDWRVTNPAMHAFFAALWPQSSGATGARPGIRDDGSIRGGGAGEIEPMDNLSQFHYFKELFLDSATTMTVLSCTPTSPDTQNPLPLAKAAATVHAANGMSGAGGKSQRSIMHAFVMPNRGSAGMTQDQAVGTVTGTGAPVQGPRPLFLDEELELMMTRAETYGSILGGWKTYCAWGDVPYASGWQLDSDYGMEFLAQVKKVSEKYPDVPPVVATHKGFSLPGFDQRGAAPRDVGPAAKANPDVRFMIYHSGYDIFESGVPVGGDAEGPYPGDDQVDSSNRSVNSFIKSLRENNWSAANFKEPGKAFGNVPNVWAELGSVWREHISDPNACVHLLGKLITHVGPKRIAWGTDSLWYGSPQREIVALRRLNFTEEAKALYNLPYGLDGDVEDPTQPAPSPDRTIRNGILGRNAALAYNIDPDEQRTKLVCDEINQLRESEYLDDVRLPTETAPMRENKMYGARTRRDVLKGLVEGPWAP